MSVKDFITEFS